MGRWLKGDPAHDVELSDGPNLYSYVQNNPVAFRDLLGLESVSFKVVTVIRPPDREAGTKTTHSITVDTDSGGLTAESKFIGPTRVLGREFTGKGTLSVSVSGGNGCIKADFVGSVRSAFLPVRIDYKINISYDARRQSGALAGTHDGYPSYEVWKNGTKIYDFKQGYLPELFGSRDVKVGKPF